MYTAYKYLRHVHPVYDKYGVYYCVVEKTEEQSYGIVLPVKVLSIHYFPASIHDWNFKFYPKFFRGKSFSYSKYSFHV